MKNIFLLIVFLLTGGLFTQSKAQSNLYVKMQDGTVLNYPLTSLKKITFSEASMQLNEKDGNMTAVDMSAVGFLTFSETSLSVGNVYADGSSFTIYPNPVTDVIYIDNVDVEDIEIAVYNASGCLMLVKRADTTQAIDVSNLAKGMYLIKINGRTCKFIKL